MLSEDFKWENTSSLNNNSGKLKLGFFFLGKTWWNHVNIYNDMSISSAVEIISEVYEYLSS